MVIKLLGRDLLLSITNFFLSVVIVIIFVTLDWLLNVMAILLLFIGSVVSLNVIIFFVFVRIFVIIVIFAFRTFLWFIWFSALKGMFIEFGLVD